MRLKQAVQLSEEREMAGKRSGKCKGPEVGTESVCEK